MDKKRIAITFLIVFTNAIGATAILPMLPLYVERQFRATPVQAMLVIAAFYAAQFVAAPWLGKLSDRFGRRPILIISQTGTIVSYLLFIFAAPLGDPIGLILGMSSGLVVIYLCIFSRRFSPRSYRPSCNLSRRSFAHGIGDVPQCDHPSAFPARQ